MLRPDFLNEDGQYFYSSEDFVTDIHRVAFGAIFNLHQMGAEKITPKTVEDYLQTHPESYAIYKKVKGCRVVAELREQCGYPELQLLL